MANYASIIDYGAGNLLSVSNSLGYLGIAREITADRQVIERSSAIILPGVGAFDDAARSLKNSGLFDVIREQARQKPFLGICLGMQLLFDRGEEGEGAEGLGLIPGRVARIKTKRKLPHIGWNSLRIHRPCALTRGLGDSDYVYFVHSYAAVPEDEADLCADTEYGAQVTALVARGNIFGCQFHPEKSGEVGLSMLKNFGELWK